MNRHVKKLWCEALKSGRYMKGGGALRQGDKFCCLGVLADLLDPNGWLGQQADEPVGHVLARTHGNIATYLTCESGDVVGLTWAEQKHLAYINDQSDTFSGIADYIEKSL